MNQEEPKLMEGEILAEIEPASTKTSSKKPLITKASLLTSFKKISGLVKNFKPKIISLLILFILIIAAFAGLMLVASQNKSSVEIPPEVAITSPKEAATQKDPQTQQIESVLGGYNQKVDHLNSTIENFQPPNVDFKMTF